MKKNLLFIVSILMTINLYAYTDNDMDGVEDSSDKCPNTPLTDLADMNGCSAKSLVSPHHYDIIVGVNYSDADYDSTDTLATSLQVDYYYKQFSVQASTSFFKSDGDNYSDSGLRDSFLGASYSLNKIGDLSISLGAGMIIPTYDTELDNNNMDYMASVNLSYSLENFNIFGGYIYTLVNDDDLSTNESSITYQNTNAYSAGIGYYLSSKLYMSGSYNISDSINSEVNGNRIPDIETASIYGYYTIDAKRFVTVSYANGLSDSASNNYLSLRLGFLF